jgi:predicted RNA-binding Zn ribbon-like protein
VEEEGRLMLEVTWEWIAIDEPALDVANTVAVEKAVEHDLLAPDGEYGRWAAAAAQSAALASEEAAAIGVGRRRILELREHIRAVLRAAAAGDPLPDPAVTALNEATRAAPQWIEVGVDGQIQTRSSGSALDRLLAGYARSAMTIAAEGSARLRVCNAPSCGMFYRPRRRQQRWCSEPCGNRARFARHYRARRT